MEKLLLITFSNITIFDQDLTSFWDGPTIHVLDSNSLADLLIHIGNYQMKYSNYGGSNNQLNNLFLERQQ